MTIYDFFIHIAYALLLISYAARGILLLRTIAIGSSICLIIFAASRSPIYWEPIFWSSIFILINTAHIFLVIKERLSTDLTKNQKLLYESLFKKMPIYEFKKLAKLGKWKTAQKGQVLVTENAYTSSLIAMLTGTVQIKKDGRLITELKKPHFLSEMSYVTQGKTTAEVVSSDDTLYIEWTRHTIEKCFKKNSEMKNHFQTVIGFDLIHKIQNED